jgi:DNA-binding HxlR family transcriptional regulator
MATKYYVEDDELAFSVVEEPEFFRLRVLRSQIDEDAVEDFLDTTVEWLSSNPTKGILIDFSGVRSVCPAFTIELQRNFEEIKSHGLYVRFVNVDPSIEPYIDVQNITIVMNVLEDKPVLSARDVLRDLAHNVSDDELMRKHGLSPKGLKSMYRKLLRKGLLSKHILAKRAMPDQLETPVQNPGNDSKKPSVNAWDVLKDLEDGMPDSGLMQKYRLSPKGLDSLMRKLKEKGLISKQQLAKKRHGQR